MVALGVSLALLGTVFLGGADSPIEGSDGAQVAPSPSGPRDEMFRNHASEYPRASSFRRADRGERTTYVTEP